MEYFDRHGLLFAYWSDGAGLLHIEISDEDGAMRPFAVLPNIEHWSGLADSIIDAYFDEKYPEMPAA